MEPAQKSRFKIFLWDQFIRPIYLLLNVHQLQALLLALLMINFVVWKNIYAFWVLSISLILIFFYQIYKYYKSGEFIHHYRDYKSERGKYKDYRKLTKELKRENESNLIEGDKFVRTGPVLDEKSLQEARNE